MSGTEFRVADAAALLGVSDDTIRRWAADGRLTLREGAGGVKVIEGRELARVATEYRVELDGSDTFSARNRMRGIVTALKTDGVMAQVDIQAGPFRLVSLVSREAADELQLQPGSLVVASVKATNVVLELPRRAGSAGHTDPAAEFG